MDTVYHLFYSELPSLNVLTWAMVRNIRSITTIPSHILKQVLSSVFNGEIFSFVIRELTVVGNGVKYSGRRYWLALDVSMMTVEPRSALDLVRHRELITN